MLVALTFTGLECTLSDGSVSLCKEVKDCPEILTLLKAGGTITKCNIKPSTVEVCCPAAKQELTLTDSQQKEQAAKTKARESKFLLTNTLNVESKPEF